MNKITPSVFCTHGKKTSIVFVLFLFVQISWGQVSLPHHDAFNYTNGQSLPSQTAGGWFLSASATSDMLITTGSLTYSNLASSSGNKVSFEGGGEDAIKTFTATTSGTVYYSYLMNITGMTGFTGGTFTGFINSGTLAPGSGDVRGCVWVRPSTTGNYNIGFSPRSNGSPVYGTADYPIGTPVLIVVSHQFVSGNNNDIVKLWVNPTPGQSQPAENMTALMSSDPANLGGFFIRQNSNASTPKVELDELRFGLNWADVTPANVPCVWDGTAWSNSTGPNASTEAILEDDYSTAINGVFTAKKLTLDSGTLTVNSGTTITVVNELINNMSDVNIIIQNNANLIQNGTVNNNEGNVTVQRNSSPLFRLDYTLWSSPVSGTQTLQDFSSLTISNRFYELAALTNTYIAVSSGSTFTSGKGYLVRAPNTWVSYSPSAIPVIWSGSFVGKPNNGNISFTTSNQGSGYNSVGNPYPSTLNIDAFIAANSANIDGTLWLLRKKGDPTAPEEVSYSTCTTIGCTVANGLTYTDQNSISPGQGFIVKATSTSLVFNNQMRIASSVNQFFRNANGSTPELSRYWLNLSSANNPTIRKKLIAYTANATLGVDYGLDGKSLDDAQTALVSIIDNQEFVIQARPEFEISDVVSLRFKTNVADNYTITLDQFDGLFSGQAIYLKDNLLNTINDLTVSSYSFASSAGIFNDRFEIVYQQSTLGIDKNGLNESNILVYKNNGDIVINTGVNDMQDVRIYDISGRLLTSKSQINAKETKVFNNLAKQILLVKITSAEGQTITKKIIN